jgi:hypothetical protein
MWDEEKYRTFHAKNTNFLYNLSMTEFSAAQILKFSMQKASSENCA